MKSDLNEIPMRLYYREHTRFDPDAHPYDSPALREYDKERFAALAANAPVADKPSTVVNNDGGGSGHGRKP
jgi:hypothetical protein